jgi:hypothetical protein
LERFDLRLPPDRVAALKRLAGRLTYEGDGATVRWTDLVRRGVDWVLQAEGERTAVGLDRPASEGGERP